MLGVLVAGLLAVTGCAAGDPAPPSAASPQAAPSPGPATPLAPPTLDPPEVTSPSPQPSCAQRVLTGMSEAQRVGQLFMVGAASGGAGSASVRAVQRYHVGAVILTGRAHLSVATVRAGTDRLRQLADQASSGAGLWIAADQEGGQVQALRGPGFSTIPSALTQGRLGTTTLRQDAQLWGRQLRAAGVNLDLAPVLGVVPPGTSAQNQALGIYQREYGHDVATVATHGAAFVRGMADAGVESSVKHFPGLGRVHGNTDFVSGVTDRVTTRHDPYLQTFRAGLDAGAGFVMIALAKYDQIDPHQLAVFSPLILRGMLRGDLGFSGVILSDDMGQAVAVRSMPAGQRAVAFLAAGGDMVLTVDPALVAPMTAAVLARAQHNAGFRKTVDTAALQVLTSKQTAGLLSCPR